MAQDTQGDVAVGDEGSTVDTPNTSVPNPDSDSTISAAGKVINVVELLEMILLNLPLCEIFVLQRINKATHDTIRGSTKLKQRMFLEPAPIEATQWNPILNAAFFQRDEHDDNIILKGHPCVKDSTSLHFLDFRHITFSLYKPTTRTTVSRECCSHDLAMKAAYAFTPSMVNMPHPVGHVLPLHKDIRESWRDMFIAFSPPEQQIRLDVLNANKGSCTKSVTTTDAEGTLDSVFEWLTSTKNTSAGLIRSSGRREFRSWIEWNW